MDRDSSLTVPKKKWRIGNLAIVAFVICALVVDIVGLIPIVKDVAEFIFWGIAGYALWKMGHPFINYRTLAPEAIAFVMGLIPGLQELPENLAGIIAIIILSRLEDKTGISIIKPMSGGGILPAAKDMLNSEGRREPQKDETGTGRRNANTQPLNIDGVRKPG